MKDKKEQISASVAPKTRRQLERLAKEDGRSMSSYICRLIEGHLEKATA